VYVGGMENPFRKPGIRANRITINGKVYEAPAGSSVTITNDTLYVNGAKVTDGLQGVVKVVWEGPLASLEAGGSVECGDVSGDVHGGNSVTCGNVQGNVRAGNSVTCGDIKGKVRAGNGVSRR